MEKKYTRQCKGFLDDILTGEINNKYDAEKEYLEKFRVMKIY